MTVADRLLNPLYTGTILTIRTETTSAITLSAPTAITLAEYIAGATNYTFNIGTLASDTTAGSVNVSVYLDVTWAGTGQTIPFLIGQGTVHP